MNRRPHVLTSPCSDGESFCGDYLANHGIVGCVLEFSRTAPYPFSVTYEGEKDDPWGRAGRNVQTYEARLLHPAHAIVDAYCAYTSQCGIFSDHVRSLQKGADAFTLDGDEELDKLSEKMLALRAVWKAAPESLRRKLPDSMAETILKAIA